MLGLNSYVEDGVMNDTGIRCAVEVLRYFHIVLESLRITNVSVFGTASLRNIGNSIEAVSAIERATGFDIEVLSGAEEATYSYMGAMRESKESSGICVDVGGASTEIIRFEDEKIKEAQSYDTGSLKIYRECVGKILPGRKSLIRIDRELDRVFSDVKKKKYA